MPIYPKDAPNALQEELKELHFILLTFHVKDKEAWPQQASREQKQVT